MRQELQTASYNSHMGKIALGEQSDRRVKAGKSRKPTLT